MCGNKRAIRSDSRVLYPLMQGQDSLLFEAMWSWAAPIRLLTICGTITAFGQAAPQIVITMPILVGLDGVQMSKSRATISA